MWSAKPYTRVRVPSGSQKKSLTKQREIIFFFCFLKQLDFYLFYSVQSHFSLIVSEIFWFLEVNLALKKPLTEHVLLAFAPSEKGAI